MTDQPTEPARLTKVELSALVEQLRQVVKQMPPGTEDDGKRISRLVDELIEEVSASEPSQNALVDQASQIKQVTDKIATTAPEVVQVTAKIVTGILDTDRAS